MRERTVSFYWIVGFFLFTGLAYFIQTLTFLNGDVGSLLYDTRLFLAGGSYVTDFFETNPPMIFLLYAPASLLIKWFSWSSVITMRFYIIVVAWMSITLSAFLLKKIIKKEDRVLRVALIVTLIFVYLFFPTIEFGQREHFFLILFMPYVLAAALFVEHKPIHPLLAVCLGVMAGLGIGMKPYFLAPLILLECYIIYKKRVLLGWLRIEAICCAAVLILYLIGVYYYCPSYFHIMLPLISHWYYISIQQPWSVIFSPLAVIFSLFSFGLNVVCYKKNPYSSLNIIFILVLFGNILAFAIARAGWFYHVFPAAGTACLLMTFFAYQLGVNVRSRLWLLVISFLAPCYIIFFGLHLGIHIKHNSSLNEVITYIQSTHPAPSIYCFSSNTTGDCFTLIYHTKSQYAGRYPFFWWLRGLRLREAAYRDGLPLALKQDKDYLVQVLIDDLNKDQPQLVLINQYDSKMAQGESFHFVDYFSDYSGFREAWGHYRFLKTIGVFEVYQRVG